MPKNSIIKKSLNDKFYTNPEVAKTLFLDFCSLGLETSLFFEPSAGNGSFSNLLPLNSIAIDIEPESTNILKIDFFDFDLNSCDKDGLTFIGNPPFGTRNSLTKKFIEKCTAKGSTIAFVLPSVFSKPVFHKIFPKNFKLVFEKDLPFNSFVLNDLPYNVPSVFQVWTKSKTDLPNLRKEYIIPNGNSDFIFSTPSDSDFFVFGSAPNKCIFPNMVSPKNRGYFLKVISKNKSVDDIISIFQAMNWKNFGKSSVSGGVFWLTKQELISSYDFFVENPNEQ